MTNQEDVTNPLQKQLEDGGIWVLSDTPCSGRRVEFLTRGNSFLGFYYVVAALSNAGFGSAMALEAQGKLSDSTPVRFAVSGTEIRMNHGRFKKIWQSTGRHLTNQVFLMIYGNFEAYLADLVIDGLIEADPGCDAYTEAKTLLIRRKWEGKIGAIDHRLSLGLKGRLLKEWFEGIEMHFLGTKCSQPMDFLEKVSDLRDRVVHYGSRVDAGLASSYSEAGFKEGDEIAFPFDVPTQLHLFLTHLSNLVDDAFCRKFGWPREIVGPENLLD